eukprot:2867119-Karenia_brevis.AAC.1
MQSQRWPSSLDGSQLQPGEHSLEPPQPAMHHRHSLDAIALVLNFCWRTSVLRRWGTQYITANADL